MKAVQHGPWNEGGRAAIGVGSYVRKRTRRDEPDPLLWPVACISRATISLNAHRRSIILGPYFKEH
jgi:hypothetical protein